MDSLLIVTFFPLFHDPIAPRAFGSLRDTSWDGSVGSNHRMVVIPLLAFFPPCRSLHLHYVVLKQCLFSHLHRLPPFTSFIFPLCMFSHLHCVAFMMFCFCTCIAYCCLLLHRFACLLSFPLAFAPFCVPALFSRTVLHV